MRPYLAYKHYIPHWINYVHFQGGFYWRHRTTLTFGLRKVSFMVPKRHRENQMIEGAPGTHCLPW